MFDSRCIECKRMIQRESAYPIAKWWICNQCAQRCTHCGKLAYVLDSQKGLKLSCKCFKYSLFANLPMAPRRSDIGH